MSSKIDIERLACECRLGIDGGREELLPKGGPIWFEAIEAEKAGRGTAGTLGGLW